MRRGAFAGVDLEAVAEGHGIDGVVALEIGRIEQDVVQAQASGELEVGGDAPLVLEVEGSLPIGDVVGGLLYAVEAVGDGEGFGGCPVDELVHGCVAVVEAAVAHVAVGDVLVFVGKAEGEGVGVQVEGDVVPDVGDGVGKIRVAGEEFVAHGHVGLQGAFHHDVHVGEALVSQEGAVLVVVGEGGEELVGDLIADAAVQVQGGRVHLAVIAVHVAGEGHGLRSYAFGVGEPVAGVAGVVVGGVPHLVEGVVVAQGEPVVVVDVPVDPGEGFAVDVVAGEVGGAAGVVAVVLFKKGCYAFHVAEGGAGDVAAGLLPVFAGAVGDDLLGLLLLLVVDEEEELVLDDGTAQGGAEGPVRSVLIGVGRCLEGVGAGLGHGVDAAADEAGLAHVVGGNDELDLVDGFDGDGVAAAGQLTVQAEVVVEVGAVHGEVGHAPVAAGDAEAVGVRGEADEVGNAPANAGHALDLGRCDIP